MSRLLTQAVLAAVADKSGSRITQATAGDITEAIFNTIRNQLKTEGSFTLQGFGTFRTVARAARDGVNPSTGTPIKIAATQTVTFKVSPSLKQEAQNFVVAAKKAGKQVKKPAATTTTTTKASKK